MSILDFLFRNKPWLIKKSITDDLFGLMWFNKDKNPEFNHYQGHLFFNPTNSEIDIFIDSDKEGFDQQQKSFYKEIVKNYSEISDKSATKVNEYLSKKQNKPDTAMDFITDFRLFAISISRNPAQKWSMHFDSEKYGISGITIQFKNWEIVDVND